jgi:hypothetical protein
MLSLLDINRPDDSVHTRAEFRLLRVQNTSTRLIIGTSNYNSPQTQPANWQCVNGDLHGATTWMSDGVPRRSSANNHNSRVTTAPGLRHAQSL